MSNSILQNPLGKTLRCDDGSLVTQPKFGSGACQFNGQNAYLSLSDSNDWNFGSGDFTIDCWVNWSSLPTVDQQSIITKTGGPGYRSFLLDFDSTNVIRFIYFVDGTNVIIKTFSWTPSVNIWYHLAVIRNGVNDLKVFVNGTQIGSTQSFDGSAIFKSTSNVIVGSYYGGCFFTGSIDELRISKGIARWTSNFTPQTTPYTADSYTKLLLHFDNNLVDSSNNNYGVTNYNSSLIGVSSFNDFKKLLNISVGAGQYTAKTIISSYSLTYSANYAYYGAVLAPNGDIHFVPRNATVGQKLKPDGTSSTYSLIYTTTAAYQGGVLAPNGDIHFIPFFASVGQKVSPSGVVSTYSLVFTSISAYRGGVLAPNGDIHFVPTNYAPVGQKVNTISSVVSTYSLVLTGVGYMGGVLAPNGDIHFIPFNAPVGQKVSVSGVVSTYSLICTASNGAYACGCLAPNGDIHMARYQASVGQKIDTTTGIVSTYSLVHSTPGECYYGAVLAPNGDIYFVPYTSPVGQKINTVTGIVSTYAMAYTFGSGHVGGVLDSKGVIHFVQDYDGKCQKISTAPCQPFSPAVCCSPFLNKF